jgi:ornithine cyclodeaminase
VRPGDSMHYFSRPEIEARLDEADAMTRIRDAFVALSHDRAHLAAVGYLEFPKGGHSHIKSAHVAGQPFFVVKIVNGFPENAGRGLATGQGLIALFDAETGEAAGLLFDEGCLTDIRTGMTGAIAADLICEAGPRTLGIIGSGVQAEMQIRFIRRHLEISELLLWARNGERGAALAARTGARFVSRETLCTKADLIVTTTSATEPLLRDAWIRPGTRIIAVGSDSPGKRELEPQTVARARLIVDSPAQCIAEGETGWAVRAGLVDPDRLIELGDLIAQPRPFGREETVIVDLTGTAVQDHAIASTAWIALTAGGRPAMAGA